MHAVSLRRSLSMQWRWSPASGCGYNSPVYQCRSTAKWITRLRTMKKHDKNASRPLYRADVEMSLCSLHTVYTSRRHDW